MKKFLLSLFAVLTASFAMAQTELLTNGGFEEWSEDYPVAWKSTSTASTTATVAQSTDKHSGSYAVEIKGITSSNKRMASKEITLKAGTYTFSIWMKSAGEASVSKIGYVPIVEGSVGSYVYPKGSDNKEIELAVTPTYTQFTNTFTLAEKTTICLVVMNNKKSNAVSIIADDASLTTTDGGIEEGGDEGGGGDTPTPTIITVAEAQAATGTVSVAGTVYALCGNGAVLGDETGFIYYFNKSIADMKWKIGDQGVIKGAVSKYGGFNQFTDKAEVEYKGHIDDLAYPTPVEMDGAAMDAWLNTPVIQYVKINGTLTISGTYYNLNVEGTEKAIGSLVAPTEDVLAEGVTNNSEVTVEGFAMYISSSKYVNIVATKVTINKAGETKDITNEPATAYTTTEAKAIIDEGLGLEQKVYVKGKISQVGIEKDGNMTDLPGNEHKNATYFITDGTTEMEVYRGRNIENTDFTAADQLAVDDEVIVYGQLQKYGDTYEMVQGNYIYSRNGITDGITIVKLNKTDGVIYDLTGRRVEKAVKGINIINGKKVIK